MENTSFDLEKESETSADYGWVDIAAVPGETDKNPAAIDHASSLTDNMITCKICQLSFSGVAPYEQHIVGTKHRKKVVKESMKKKYGPKYLEVLNGQQHGDEVPVDTTVNTSGDDDVVIIQCDVCNKICTGLVPYKLHIAGKKHQKQVHKEKFLQKLKENPNFELDEEKMLGENSVYTLPQAKPFAHCELCTKKFSGPKAYQDHMSSGVHKRKLDMENLTKKLTGVAEGPTEGVSLRPRADVFAICEVCGKNFTGPVPYQVHMISDTHKKKVKSLELTEKMKSLSMNAEEVGIFHCKDCERSFCIPEQFEQHLKSSTHAKRKIKQEMLKKLQSTYPEMEVKVASNGDGMDDDSLLDESTILFCSVCNKVFSGPEAALDHFNSSKHTKVKKHLLAVQQWKA